jgi:hypothetical protein
MMTMRILVHNNLRVADIQERFREAFPSLCLQFYPGARCMKNGSRHEAPVDSYRSLQDIRSSHHEGYLEVQSGDTVQAVEELFREEFGLKVRVLWKEPETRTLRHLRSRKLEAQGY